MLVGYSKAAVKNTLLHNGLRHGSLFSEVYFPIPAKPVFIALVPSSHLPLSSDTVWRIDKYKLPSKEDTSEGLQIDILEFWTRCGPCVD